MEEPSDELLHELMEQIAESARKSSARAAHVLQARMQATIDSIVANRRTSL